MDKESYLDFRKRIQNYVLSMTIFKRHYLEGTLSEELYELLEVTIAKKYGLSRRSAKRNPFQLNKNSKEFNK